MNIAVLGCGPAGLVAAEAAMSLGHHVEVFSKKRKSEMFGAQYLHNPIPGIEPGPRTTVHYQIRGSAEDYRRKVYGAQYDGTVSPGVLRPAHNAWDIRTTYGHLWDKYGKQVINSDINARWVDAVMSSLPLFDAVISTLPAYLICKKPASHKFKSQKIWAIGDAPERNVSIGISIYDDTVLCNGEQFPLWYRASRIFGYGTLEYSQQGPKPDRPVAEVNKPLSTTCDCWPEILKVGRYGAWRKGYLVHHVYGDVLQWLQLPSQIRR